MRKVGEKKGQGHLEIIISFVMFISFTFFLIFYIQPTKKNVLEESSLLGIKNAFFANTSTNLTISFVNSSGGCFPQPTNLNNERLLVKDVEDYFFYVWSSPEFGTTALVSCEAVGPPPVPYKLGYTTDKLVVSNNSMQVLKQMYYSNYQALKAKFGVPPTIDFSISSEDYSLESKIPQNTEVQSVLYRQEVLYKNGTLKNQDFIFKIW